MDISQLTDIVIGDINMEDWPDLVDACLESAKIDGRDLTEEELDDINEHHSKWVYEQAVREGWEDMLNAGDYARKAARAR